MIANAQINVKRRRGYFGKSIKREKENGNSILVSRSLVIFTSFPYNALCQNKCIRVILLYRYKYSIYQIIDLDQRSSFLSDQSYNKRRCCKAYTANCLSCSTGRSKNEICRKQPNVVGCEGSL